LASVKRHFHKMIDLVSYIRGKHQVCIEKQRTSYFLDLVIAAARRCVFLFRNRIEARKKHLDIYELELELVIARASIGSFVLRKPSAENR
jgi:hypothetical protein